MKTSQKIWNAFLETEEKDFREAFKYGKEEIEKIGVEKFLKAIGFEKTEDVSKWRTDALHLVICPDCQNDFGIYEYYSICPNCEKNYDMERVHKMHTNMMHENANEANPGEFLFVFSFSKSLRNFCLKNSNGDIEPIYSLAYNENNQNFEVKLLSDLKKGDKAKLVLSNGEYYEEDNCSTFVLKKDAKVEGDDILLDIEKYNRVVPINALAD